MTLDKNSQKRSLTIEEAVYIVAAPGFKFPLEVVANIEANNPLMRRLLSKIGEHETL